MEENMNTYRVLAAKPERRRPLGRPRLRCEGNIKMDLRVLGWGVMDWIQPVQEKEGRVVGSYEQDIETSDSIT
jgi:hypothetical protein